MFWGILGPLGFPGIALLKDKSVTNKPTRELMNKHNETMRKPGNIELILLGMGCVMVIFGSFIRGYVSVLGIFPTIAGCYLWVRRKNRSWMFMFWGILGPLGFPGMALLKNKSVTDNPNRTQSTPGA